MSDARVPLAYRDSCAHLLIPLNKCRHEEWFLPWKCVVSQPPFKSPTVHELDPDIMRDCEQDERHSYEKCQYEEFKLRVKKMDEMKAAAAASAES
jgi:NADH dehydrogenase (ubiquinone) 1 beta subcomplex subunit 7